MPQVLGCQSLGRSYSGRVLFENLTLSLQEGECLGVVGPNGSGKTTLLRTLAAEEKPEFGTVTHSKGARLVHVPQAPVFDPELSAAEVVEQAAARAGLDATARLGSVRVALGRAGFTDGTTRTGTLSGGWLKRLALAAALAGEPSLVLLDEPTNHLDLEGVLWLESLLARAPFASVVVSHDRYLLEHVATRMLELSRVFPGGSLQLQGNYSRFLERKSAFLEAQASHQSALATRLKRELAWLKRGPKARTSKSRHRTAEARRLEEEFGELRERRTDRRADLSFTATERKTKQLVVAEEMTLALGGKPLFDELSFKLRPGSRLGLVGPNGSGKTSLLRVLAGELEPDQGRLKRADDLRVLLFEQQRQRLDPRVSLRRALAPEGDNLRFRDQSVHVATWARRFNFPSEQLDMPVGSLSGGEQARLAIAQLVLEPADLLLLDEPTNDLDIPTLEVLEESLLEFPGALVLVTHDRFLLERVTHGLLGLDGAGGATLFADFEQWMAALAENRRRPEPPAKADRPAPPRPGRKRLGYLEQREWDGLETRIEEAEAQAARLEAQLADPEVATHPERAHEVYASLEAARAEVDGLYQRWAELEAKLH